MMKAMNIMPILLLLAMDDLNGVAIMTIHFMVHIRQNV